MPDPGHNLITKMTNSNRPRNSDWVPIAIEVARTHRLYGAKNWLAVFALGAIMAIGQTLGSIGNEAAAAGVSAIELLAVEDPWTTYVKALLAGQVVVCGPMLWLLASKSRYFRSVSICSLLAYPAYLGLLGLMIPSDDVGKAVASTLVPQVFISAIWIAYLQKSRRVRVTFENKVRAADDILFGPGLRTTPSPEPARAAQSALQHSREVTEQSANPSKPTANIGAPSYSRKKLVLGAGLVIVVAGTALWANGYTPPFLDATYRVKLLDPSKLHPLDVATLGQSFERPRVLLNAAKGKRFDFDALLRTDESVRIATEQAQLDRSNHVRYLASAKNGEMGAMIELARMFRDGSGVPKDPNYEIHWTWRAATLGDPRSQAIIGSQYLSGYDVTQDSDLAREWLAKAAERGDDGAQIDLAKMYAKGTGVPQDFQVAMAWALESAGSDNAEAQYLVGKWFSEGKGLERDLVQAHMWLNLAATSGVTDAKRLRAKLGETMSTSQVTKAQRLASQWKPK